jgi:hypothetical protein
MSIAVNYGMGPAIALFESGQAFSNVCDLFFDFFYFDQIPDNCAKHAQSAEQQGKSAEKDVSDEVPIGGSHVCLFEHSAGRMR